MVRRPGHCCLLSISASPATRTQRTRLPQEANSVILCNATGDSNATRCVFHRSNTDNPTRYHRRTPGPDQARKWRAAQKRRLRHCHKKIRNTWVQEFNARNARGVAALYAPDAVLMRWDGSVHSYDSILAEFERSANGNAHNYVVHPLHFEHSGDLGYETGAYNVTLRDRVSEGNYLVVVKKINGEWKIVAHATVPNPRTP
jgi:ketosteroid isomerase-like protein